MKYLEQNFRRVYKLDRPRGGITGNLWSKFFPRVHNTDRSRGDSKLILYSNFFRRIHTVEKRRVVCRESP
jgi:hypothetical protein